MPWWPKGKSAMENSSAYERIPACCLTCGNYQPQFYRVLHKQCAAFGTVAGVKWDQCGAWCKRIDPVATEGA